MTDLTKIPRPLIYLDKRNLDDYPINDANSMLSLYFEQLSQRPFILRLYESAETALAIFNNAYYITKLVMKEKYPRFYIKKYLNIASDGDLNEEWEHHVCPATMALVCNLLIWNELLYAHDWVDFYEKVREQFKDWDKRGNAEGKEDFMKLFIDPGSCQLDSSVPYKSMISSSINPQTIQQTEEYLSEHSSSWGKVTNGYNSDSINELASAVCDTEEEKNLLVEAIQKEKSQQKGLINQILPSVEFFQNTCGNETEVELQRELEEAKQRIKELESENHSEKWISCFDGFLHPSLKPEAIANALKNINSPHLPKNERGYWWTFATVLAEINWSSGKKHKLLLQWANLHFDCGWDWKKDNQFKFSDLNEKIKTLPTSKWNQKEVGNVNGDYYGELAKAMKDAFTEDVNGALVDKMKFYPKGTPKRINDLH